MEISITKMSQNGQVVIPSEIRKDAKIGASTKFLVFNEGGNILLKQLRRENLTKDMELIEKIERSEEQIAKGKHRSSQSLSQEPERRERRTTGSSTS